MSSGKTSQLVWLITGAATGIGRELALAALKRGDKVIATARARSLAKLEDLRAYGADILELDVTAPLETLHVIIQRAIAIHGRVDVLVNNAAYLLFGAIEENTPEEIFDQFNTVLFGAINLSRALLPYMRERKSGTIIWIGSLGGWQATASLGAYSSTKFALRGISMALHDEISPLGLRSACINLGTFPTAMLSPDMRWPNVTRIPAYKATNDATDAILQVLSEKPKGDAKKAAKTIVDVVRGEGIAAGKTFPTSLMLGSDSFELVKQVSETTLAQLEEWKEVSYSTDFSS